MRRAWRAAKSLWDRYFFLPEPPEPLAACRIIACAALLAYYGPWVDFRGWGGLSDTFYEPVGIWAELPGPLVLSDGLMLAAQWLWKLSLALGCVGLFTRPALWVAFALGFYLLGITTSFGKVSHSEPTAVFVLLVLALSRCGDALSLDTRLGLRRRAERPSGEYRWPARVVWIVMALVFGIAGWQKVRGAGLAWVSPDSFVPQMIRHFYANEPPTDLALWLSTHRPLMWFAGAAALAGECLFPLALFSRRLRLMLVPAMFVMQANIALLMGIYFWPFMAGYAFWVPWSWLMFDRRVPWTLPWRRPFAR